MRFVFFLILFLLLTACSSIKKQEIPAPGTSDWLEQVDITARLQGNDALSSKIGSHEWMQAISDQYGGYDSDGDGHGPDLGSEEWASALHYKIFNEQLLDMADKVYISVDGERLAVFYDDTAAAAFIIYSGRKITLPQSITTSGVYFSQDKNNIFWIKDRTAAYWRQGEKVFEGFEECR